MDRRRDAFRLMKQSTVVEHREDKNGILRLKGRVYRRKKDGEITEIRPYWYFHYRAGGKKRTLYLGMTDNLEVRVNKLVGRVEHAK